MGTGGITEGGMNMEKKLCELLSDPRIKKIAPDAIRKWDLSKEPVWNMPLNEIKAQYFSSNIEKGFDRLYAAAGSGEWYYPLYTEEECAADPAREGTNIVWFPSADTEADKRPFVLLVPGGGFVNVWNLTEGWPVAAQFNDVGYHVFILTYQVEGEKALLEKNMKDFARAFEIICTNAAEFHVQPERYITCGFSAGGYLVCLWNTGKGYAAYGLPKPVATFPVYPVTSLKEQIRYDGGEQTDAVRLYGCDLKTASETDYEIPEHAEGFPPSAIFVAAGDELVDPANSRMLAEALEKLNIPCRLETGAEGGHGFGDGTGMCMDGWIKRAVEWTENL